MTTPISVFMSGPKKAKNGTFARQIFGSTDLKHGMHKQLDFQSNMAGIPPGYTFSHWCVKQKSKKQTNIKQLLNNAKELIHKPILIYILVRKYVCWYVCLGIIAKHFDQKG